MDTSHRKFKKGGHHGIPVKLETLAYRDELRAPLHVEAKFHYLKSSWNVYIHIRAAGIDESSSSIQALPQYCNEKSAPVGETSWAMLNESRNNDPRPSVSTRSHSGYRGNW